MGDTTSQRFVLAFPAPTQVQDIYRKARTICQNEYGFALYPGSLGLHLTVKSPFDLGPEIEPAFCTRIERLLRGRKLPAIETAFGAIGRLRQPEDVVYLEAGGDQITGIVDNLLAELESLGVPRSPLDGAMLHVSLAKGKKVDHQDLAFGVCADLCACRERPRSAMLGELVLYDRMTKGVAKNWSLQRH
jgi:hypothetical protein